MRRATRGLFATALAAAALAGCGDDEGPQIPETESVGLREALQDVKARLDAGDCDGADQALLTVDARVAALPQDLDPDVRETVEDGVSRLDELVAEECAGREEEEPEETETETTPPETIPTTPPETETEPPPETETEPAPTETEPPPEEEEPSTPGGGGVPGPPGQEKKEKEKDG